MQLLSTSGSIAGLREAPARIGQGGVAERVHQGGGAAAYEEIRMDVYRYPLTRQLDEPSIFVTFFTSRMPGKLV